MTDKHHTIFDFETLSQNPYDGVVVSMAMVNFNELRFRSNPYSYHELLSETKFIKFNVEEQVKVYNRKIEKSTLDWWSKQNDEARKVLNPSKDDRSITELYDFFFNNMPDYSGKVYTRRNTFDPMFLTSLMKAIDKPEPYEWWDVRDTISYIEGLAGGTWIDSKFIPQGLEENFVPHDPRHDIVMDIMRIQFLTEKII